MMKQIKIKEMNGIEFFSLIFGIIQLINSIFIMIISFFVYLKKGFCSLFIQVFTLVIVSGIFSTIILIPSIRFYLKRMEAKNDG